MTLTTTLDNILTGWEEGNLDADRDTGDCAALFEWWRASSRSIRLLPCNRALLLKLATAIDESGGPPEASESGLSRCISALQKAIAEHRRGIALLGLQALTSGALSEAEMLVHLAAETGEARQDSDTASVYLACG